MALSEGCPESSGPRSFVEQSFLGETRFVRPPGAEPNSYVLQQKQVLEAFAAEIENELAPLLGGRGDEIRKDDVKSLVENIVREMKNWPERS